MSIPQDKMLKAFYPPRSLSQQPSMICILFLKSMSVGGASLANVVYSLGVVDAC